MFFVLFCFNRSKPNPCYSIKRKGLTLLPSFLFFFKHTHFQNILKVSCPFVHTQPVWQTLNHISVLVRHIKLAFDPQLEHANSSRAGRELVCDFSFCLVWFSAWKAHFLNKCTITLHVYWPGDNSVRRTHQSRHPYPITLWLYLGLKQPLSAFIKLSSQCYDN